MAVAFLATSIISYTSFQWGYNSHALKQSEQTTKQLAISAQHIINEQSKLQSVEDIISSDKEDTSIKSPVLIRTLVRVRECSGKPTC